MEQAKQSKIPRHPRADGGPWCNLTGFMDSRLRRNDQKGKIRHAEFNHPRHSELVSESWNKLRKTLNQVQGDDNSHPAIPSESGRLQKNANRTMDPRAKHEDPFKFRRHSDCAHIAKGDSAHLFRMPTENLGFTLVELAIALMVIGLLIGGVLKGQELIENTRITRVIKDIRDYETAVTIFRTTYNAKPGDMKHPDRRLPNCKTDPCQITGNGNGQIPNGSAQERINFWIHLQHAGLITYPSEQEFTVQNPSPLNAYGGHFILRSRNTTLNRPSPDPQHYYSFGMSSENGTKSSLSVTQKLDIKMDDGKAASGSVRLFSNGSTGCYDEETLEYMADGSDPECTASILSDAMN